MMRMRSGNIQSETGAPGVGAGGSVPSSKILLLFLVCLVVWVGGRSVHAQDAQLLVESNVEGATVTVDGDEVAQTNGDGEALVDGLSPGAHKVGLRKPGYWTASTRVTLEGGLTTPVTLRLTARDLEGAGLLVHTNVPNAIVLWDGEQRGQTGFDGQAYLENLTPGEHKLVVRKRGYQPAARTVSISGAGLDQDVRLQLSRALPATAESEEESEMEADSSSAAESPKTRLVVSTNVAGADVYVDSAYRGRTRRNGNLVLDSDSGAYQVTVKKEGFNSVQKTARLASGNRKTVEVTLQEAQSSLFSGRTLSLMLAGVLAALVGALAVVITIYARDGRAGTSTSEASNAFDRYRLVNVFDTSGVTSMHLAKDPVEGQQVVLRILDEEHVGNPEVVQSFLEQGKALKQIAETQPDAPVVRAYRYGREKEWGQGRPFIALEYVQGDRLSTYLQEMGVLPVREALAIIQELCNGLQAAHSHGLWHRNLTPDNVILTRTKPTPAVKIVNFQVGARELVREGAPDEGPLHDPAYMAPEQCRNEPVDGSADVYSAGILFYTLVTGKTPFQGENPNKIMEMHESAPRPRLPEEIPSYVEPLFRRMLSKEPGPRPDASNIVAIIDLVQATT